MNSITRLILHRVASGNVPLTPQVIEVLKEVSEDRAGNSSAEPREPTASAGESDHETPPSESRPGFLSPTGRWFCRMSCALLLVAGTVVATAASNFDAANEAFARANTTRPCTVTNPSLRAHPGSRSTFPHATAMPFNRNE